MLNYLEENGFPMKNTEILTHLFFFLLGVSKPYMDLNTFFVLLFFLNFSGKNKSGPYVHVADHWVRILCLDQANVTMKMYSTGEQTDLCN